MTEYITKEQAIDEVWDAFTSRDDPDLGRVIEENIERLPAADVVEVVRCKDCRHKQVDEIIFALSANPETALFCKHHGGVISETFYCSAGKRKDGED